MTIKYFNKLRYRPSKAWGGKPIAAYSIHHKIPIGGLLSKTSFISYSYI